MHIQQDFKELLDSLEGQKVDYMIVGGYAVAFHGYPRFTKDIDIFFDPSPDNIRRIIEALVQFGFPRQDLPSEMFSEKGNILTFGEAPVRVDFMNTIDGVDFSEAAPNKVRGRYGDIEVSFIGRDALLKNKKSTDRTQDKADAEALEESPEEIC